MLHRHVSAVDVRRSPWRRCVDAMWDAEHPDAWSALSPEWLAEVPDRSAAFDAGRMNASPWQDVQA